MPSTEYDEQKLSLLQEDAFGMETLPKMKEYWIPLKSTKAYIMAFLVQMLLFILNLSFLAYNVASTGQHRRITGDNATKWTICKYLISLKSELDC